MASRVHGSLVAGVVTTVTLDEGVGQIEVKNRSAAASIFFTVDGSDPAVEADDTFVVAPSDRAVVPTDQETVKLISSGTPEFSVLSR